MEVTDMGVSERRAREKSARRESIIEAAWRVLERTGTVNMDQVAHEAELSKGSLYLYFEDQAALAAAVALRAIGDIQRRIGGVDPPVVAIVRWVHEHRHAALLLLGDHNKHPEVTLMRDGLVDELALLLPETSCAEEARVVFWGACGVGLFGKGMPDEAELYDSWVP